jgi:flagellar biosynthesis protein FliQ
VNSDVVVGLLSEAVNLLLITSMPMVLLTSLVVGVLISIFQAVTQIQEQTLTFVPKMVAVFAIFIATAPWVMAKLIEFTAYIFNNIPYFAR